LGPKLAFRHQMIEQADAIGLFGLDNARGEQQLLGLRPADLAAERPGGVNPAVGRSQETKTRALAPDPDVQRRGEHGGAGGREAGAGAGGCAVERAVVRPAADGDSDRASRFNAVFLVFGGAALLTSFLLSVAATRRERFVAGTSNDEAADRIVAIEAFHRI